MVHIATLAVALAAAASSTSAFKNPCPVGTLQCGFTLNNGFFGYSREELVAALVEAGQDLSIPDVVEHSRYYCSDEQGTIGTSVKLFCGSQKCSEPVEGNPESPGPNAICKP